MPYTFKLPNGQLLNGNLWHRTNPVFASLPFITALVHAEDDMVQMLEPALEVAKINEQLGAALIVCALISFLSNLIPLLAAYCRWFGQTSAIQ